MTEDEFEKLKVQILKKGYLRWPTTWSKSTWWFSHGSLFLKYNSPRSKYKGSILNVDKIKDDKIYASCSISGAPKIQPCCHYRLYEFTTEKEERYIDSTIGAGTVKDFFGDDINIGDYVFGEFDRCVIFGKVQSIKLGYGKGKKGKKSLINKFDAAMVYVIKIQSRDRYKISPDHTRLLEMRYFIKVEDPTLYLLKL